MSPLGRSRFAALGFALPGALLTAVAVRGVMRHEVVTVAFILAPLYLASAVGLWIHASWGRSLGLVLALANLGFGLLGLVAALISGLPFVGAAGFVVLNGLIVYVLSRNFASHQEV